MRARILYNYKQMLRRAEREKERKFNGKTNTINTFHMDNARGNLALRAAYCILIF